jgi:hypothetical protein
VKPKASEGEMSYEPAGDLRHDGRGYWPAQAGVDGAEPLPAEMGARHQDRMEDLLALHARHFPQLRQALATLEADYVRRKALGAIERHLHQERRRIVGSFLSGLAKDFGRLERLMRVVREMSPAEPWIHQFQRAGRRFRFRVNYRMASLQIQSARLRSTNRLARLTELVGNLSVQIEAGMARLDAPASDPCSKMNQRSPADPGQMEIACRAAARRAGYV